MINSLIRKFVIVISEVSRDMKAINAQLHGNYMFFFSHECPRIAHEFFKNLFVPNWRIEEFRNKNVCAQSVETQYIASQ